MGPFEVVVSLAAFLLGGAIFWRLTGLIKYGIDKRYEAKRSHSLEEDVLKDYQKFKRDTQRRLQNLETIAAEYDEITGRDEQVDELQAHEPAIEMEDSSQREETKVEEGRSNLPNMLRS